MPYQKGPQKADIKPQIRHTNIAVVKYRVKKERFEIACYKNKVVNWRSGVETDLDEVLQMPLVFQSVTTGVRATKKSLKKVFGSDNQVTCCKVILEKGELQVSDKEREHAFKLMFNEVAQMVAAMCFNPKSQRPYTVSLIKDAMIKHQFHLNTGKTAKKQALDCAKFLSRHMDLERMKMLVSVAVPAAMWAPGCELRNAISRYILETRSTATHGGDAVVQMVISPESFRPLSTAVQQALQGTEDEAAAAAGGSGSNARDMDRGLGVTVVNAAVEWVSPEVAAAQAAAAGGAGAHVTDADFAASVAALEVDGEDDGDDNAVAADAAAVDRAVRQDLHQQQQQHQTQQAPQQPQQPQRTAAVPALPQAATASGSGGGAAAVPQMSCRKCKAFFDTRKELGNHMRSDWHRHNLKRHLRNIGPVTEEGFESLTAPEREAIEQAEGNYQ